MEKKKPIAVRLDPALLKQIEGIQAYLPARPSFTAVVEAALWDWVDEQNAEYERKFGNGRK